MRISRPQLAKEMGKRRSPGADEAPGLLPGKGEDADSSPEPPIVSALLWLLPHSRLFDRSRRAPHERLTRSSIAIREAVLGRMIANGEIRLVRRTQSAPTEAGARKGKPRR